MRLNFMVVRSRVLSAVVFFTSDEETKESLVAAGADPRGIYTRAELRVLVHRKITPQELRLVHAAKQWFNGEVRH
jgi:hypothetical protein